MEGKRKMGKKLILIGHGHLDSVWLWNRREGMQEAMATFSSALDRMNEYEDFVFTCSSAALYEFIEENNPYMFEEIRKRVQEGRWNIVGGWWVEPDCNIPCGEAFARHALLAQHYYMKKFGKISETGFCPDSFGHAGTLPMLLRNGKMRNYVFMRPMPGEKPLPGETFQWYAPDGSNVCAFRIPYEYLSWEDKLETHIRRCQDAVREPFHQNMCFYGVGNHGGGPTRENLECIRRLKAEQPEDIACGPVEAYFVNEDKEMRYPVVEEELQYHSPGCYSACSMVKQYNRRAENCLMESEVFCVFSDMERLHSYPNNFNEAWKHVLFNQFHDILAGTCIASAYEQIRDSYGYALTIGNENMGHALQAIAWNINIEEEKGMLPVVLFNAHSHSARYPVEVEFQGNDNVTELLDCNGNPVEFAVVPEESAAGRRTRIVFQVSVPPMGYCVLRAYRENYPRIRILPKEIQEEVTVENEYLKMSFRMTGDGGIGNLYDKENEVQVSHLGLGIPKVIEDGESDTWAHNVYQFHRVCGTFHITKMELIENNGVRQGVRVTSAYNHSVLTQEFYLYRGSRSIRVTARLMWMEKGKILKLCFYPDTVFNRSTYEIPYGKQERAANGNEVCGQRWLDYCGVDRNAGFPYGIGLVNDGKYSFSAAHNEFDMTVVRSAVFAHHEPEPLPYETERQYMDLGEHKFQYVLMPYKGKFEDSGIIPEAENMNAPIQAIVETWHKGSLPMYKSYFQTDSCNVTVAALKKAESGQGYIIRLQELYGKTTRVTLTVEGIQLRKPLEFKPYEVKSIWLSRREEDKECKEWSLVETDFLEFEEEWHVHDHE